MKALYQHNKKGKHENITTSQTGKALLTIPQINKGTAFTHDERQRFKLMGKLPSQVESLEEQTTRAYMQLQSFQSDLKKNIFLNVLHDYNQVLFYRLAKDNLEEIMPLIYTPIIGTAVKEFSVEFRQSRGLYIAHDEQAHIEEILNSRLNKDIDIIVVTDGEAVLGIGDQGVGAMDIPVAKLMVYTLFGGINHLRTLPIMLDVGTNNQELLKNPLYLGKRHARINGPAYDEFINNFVSAVKKVFPKTFLHWEDLGPIHAQKILSQYKNKLCTFNDDIQGTGVVTMAAILKGIQLNKSDLKDQQVIVFGAGNAGTGVAKQVLSAMIMNGMDQETAAKKFWLIDRAGLILDHHNNLTPEQAMFAHSSDEVSHWKQHDGCVSFAETLKQVKPTILIGCSAQAGAFSQATITLMHQHCQHPIILPLSNPTEKAEATPKDIMRWTNGKARIATGSPFEPVEWQGQHFEIAQCNNALAFPGIGLGIMISQAKHLNDDMLWAATQALANFQHKRRANARLLPSMGDGDKVAQHIALSVAKAAIDSGASTLSKKVNLEKLLDEYYWEPHYVPYIKS